MDDEADIIKRSGSIRRIPDSSAHSPGRTPGPSRLCDVQGCFATTREGKPYCPKHVDRNPYVASILTILHTGRDEIENVKLRGIEAINPRGLVATEVLNVVRILGSCSVDRIARDTRLPSVIAKAYVYSLARIGVVRLGRSVRNILIVEVMDD